MFEFRPDALSLVTRSIIGRKNSIRTLSDQELYDQAMQLDEIKELNERKKAMFNVILATRIKAPLIEAYSQNYRNVLALNAEFDDCDNWIMYADRQFCNLNTFKEYYTKYKTSNFKMNVPEGLGHFYASVNGPVNETDAIAYLDVSSDEFLNFWENLREFLDNLPQLSIAVLWKDVAVLKNNNKSNSLYLTGYGIELALKSTEYKAVDDQKVDDDTSNDSNEDNLDEIPGLHGYDFQSLKSQYPELIDKISDWETHVTQDYDSVPRVNPMSPSDLEEINLKAASYILDSPIPLITLKQISQDFPKFASLVSKQRVKSSVASESRNNGASGNQNNIFLLNGISVNEDVTNIYSLVDALKIEMDLIDSVVSLGFSPEEAVSLVISSSNAQKNRPNNADKDLEVYDYRETWQIKGRKSEKGWSQPMIWLNDLERDSRYAKWMKSLHALFKAQHNGGLPKIRKNVFNCQIFVDLSSIDDLKILNYVIQMVKESEPIRFGIMPIFSSSYGDSISESQVLARAFYFLHTEYGLKKVSEFVSKLIQKARETDLIQVAETVFDELNDQNPTKFVDLKENLDSENVIYQKIRSSIAVSDRLSLTFLKKHDGKFEGTVLLNGFYFKLDADFEENLFSLARQHLSFVQRMAYFGMIGDSTDIFEHFMSLPMVKRIRNPLLQPAEDSSFKYLKNISLEKLQKIKYVSDQDQTKSMSVWICVDLNSEESLNTVAAAIRFIKSDSSHKQKTRIAIFPTMKIRNPDTVLSSLSQKLEGIVDKDFLKKELENFGDKSVLELPDYDGIVINGRIIGPFPTGYFMRKSDFETFIEYELEKTNQIARNIRRIVNSKADMEESFLSDYIILANSLIFHANQKHVNSANLVEFGTGMDDFVRINPSSIWSGTNSCFEYSAKADAYIQLDVVIDPLSEYAQKLSQILESIHQLGKFFYIRVCLNPVEKGGDSLPLKRFYRYSSRLKPEFDKSGNLAKPIVKFEDMPVEPLLTLATDVPQAWVVMPTFSPYDLDNLRLSQIDSVKHVHAELELKSLLIEGHAIDQALKTSPRGLQLNLDSGNETSKADTIVMANLGYYQLKSSPGMWNLKIRSGRSRDFYDLVSVKLNDRTAYAKDRYTVPVSLTSFNGLVLKTTVEKKPNKLKTDILSEIEDGNDVGSIKNLMDGISKGVFKSIHDGFAGILNKDKSEEVINVFSVASGHLYERFLRIMIISVLRNTKKPVKFWFIEDFLSPVFKDFLPVMSKKLAFDFELVTYKWPKWLRYQNEKQRLIWGYKILFLDVLFPLKLSKVIFVDADQVVRADLDELIKMDLGGAPYGYTPFCDSREEIEGFRFWKVGYWKSHLRGKPYHISALYVVDLKRFRQIAAGDRLRQHYQAVTSDPNSLANLDQDLPNDMQHDIPIFSLPQDWLWCETWCDDESLKTAKTIDLCNNPMTKEPKLDRARRQLPEWTVYDEEAKALFEAWRMNSTRTTTNKKSAQTHVKDEL